MNVSQIKQKIARSKYVLSHYFEGVPDQVRRIKWFMWLFVIAYSAFAFVGIGRAKFDMTIEGWFAADDPTIVAMDDFRARFGSDDHLYIVFKPKDGDVFSAKSLETARALRKDLLDRMLMAKEGTPLKRIVKITTPANAPVLRVEGDAMVSRNLVGVTIPTTRKELEEIRKVAESQPSLPLLHYSKDYKYGGILVETNFGAVQVDSNPVPPVETPKATGKPKVSGAADVDSLELSFSGKTANERVRFKPTNLEDYLKFIEEVNKTLNKPEFTGHFEFYAVGNAASTEYDMKSLEEMGVLYPVMLLIMIAVLWFVFRSFSGVLWPSLIVILSVVWTVGTAGWLGVPFTAFLILTVIMVLVIGIADSIHILSGYEYYRNKGQDHLTAVRSSYQASANACFLTAITNMVGMLSVVFTPIVPIQVFGIATAVGIGMAFFFTIYVLPLMLDLWWAPRQKVGEGGGRKWKLPSIGKLVPNVAQFVQRFLSQVFPFVQKYKYLIAGLAFTALSACLYGMSQLKVDTDVRSMYPKDSQIRKNIDIADSKMLGSQTLEIYFDLGQEYALHDPVVMNRMDKLQRMIESKYSKYVVRTLSVVDVAKKSYQVLNDDRPEMYVVPSARGTVANTLFMFDNSNPGQRRKMVSDNYQECHISVYLRNGGSYEYSKVFEDIQKDINAAIADLKPRYPKAKASVTGMFTLMMKGSDYLSWNALSEFAGAIVTISVILLLIFGSLKAGMLSVFANAVPITLTFGLMGLFGVPLDFTTVLIAPIVLGMAVDDTVHFLSHYRHEVAIDGDVKRALVDTIKEAGLAVTFTSMILALGFSVLALSSSPSNANVGIYGAISVLVGWMCELFLTPTMILLTNLKFSGKKASLQHGGSGGLAIDSTQGLHWVHWVGLGVAAVAAFFALLYVGYYAASMLKPLHSFFTG